VDFVRRRSYISQYADVGCLSWILVYLGVGEKINIPLYDLLNSTSIIVLLDGKNNEMIEDLYYSLRDKIVSET